MKKLLSLSILLALIVLFVYHEDSNGKNIDKNIHKNIETIAKPHLEKINIKNNSHDEIGSRVEENELDDGNLSVIIEGDFNTTKEKVITLSTTVEHAQNLDACNYWWYEADELIGMGDNLEKSFSKGEHNITLVVRDVTGQETNTSVTVRAYNYFSISRFHYDAYYGNLLYVSREVTDHKDKVIIDDDGIYSKKFYTYDEVNNLLLKRIEEHYDNPNENTKTVFTYDEEGNRLSRQIFDVDEVSIRYIEHVYDENNSLVDLKVGTTIENAQSINESFISRDDNEEIVNEENSTSLDLPKDIIELNAKGEVVYEKLYYGYETVTSKMTYNEENSLIELTSLTTSVDSSRRRTTRYDKNGNNIYFEEQYEEKGQPSCHYRSDMSYNDDQEIASEVSVLLGGECPYINEKKRVYTYDDEGTLIGIKALTENGDMTEAYSTLKVIKRYVNEITW